MSGSSGIEDPSPEAVAAHEHRMPRIDSLTGLRWWAAFAVFAHHASGFAPLPGVVDAVARYGYFGVTFFFVLSGFVLTWSWSPAVRWSTFYWRRFARIYPSHVVALAVAIPVFVAFSAAAPTWALPFDPVALLLALVLLQGWFRDPAIFFAGNPAAWSLTYEAFFYATHPIVSRLLTRLRVRGALLFAAGVVVVIVGFRIGTSLPATAWLGAVPWPVQHLTEFVLGMALAWAIRCGWRPRIPVLVGLGAMIGVIAALVVLPSAAPDSALAEIVAGFANELVTLACALAITAYASRSARGGRSLLAHPVMVRLGEWSFAFYLVHATVIYAVMGWLGPRGTGWSNLLWDGALLVVCLAASAALHHLVEHPLERRLRRWKDARDLRARSRATAAAPPRG